MDEKGLTDPRRTCERDKDKLRARRDSAWREVKYLQEEMDEWMRGRFRARGVDSPYWDEYEAALEEWADLAEECAKNDLHT